MPKYPNPTHRAANGFARAVSAEGATVTRMQAIGDGLLRRSSDHPCRASRHVGRFTSSVISEMRAAQMLNARLIHAP
jgi:hypothetical protein